MEIFLDIGWISTSELIIVGMTIIFTCVCLIPTVLSTLPFDHWMFRMWEFPRFQLVCIALFNIVMLSSLSASYFDAVATLALVINVAIVLFQAHWILPFTPLFKKEVTRCNDHDGQSLSIITSNVLMTNRNAKPLIEQVLQHRPDILVTLESDIWWQQQLDDALTDYPHRVAVPKNNLYGMHVYSKVSLHNVELRYAIKPDIPSVQCNAKLNNGQLIKCFFVHPEPPSPTEAQTAKPRDKELMLYAKQAKYSLLPVIVTGDLNDVAWSPTTKAFREKSGLADPRIGRGFFNTFHAQHWWARWPLDHIFVSRHFTLKGIKRLEDIGSDHFPLFTELSFLKNDESS
jgi:endonuclease/exonuclease/phosphatase (EEP) superfamily protein YafD